MINYTFDINFMLFLKFNYVFFKLIFYSFHVNKEIAYTLISV
jgi:hypothetical protein